MLRPLCIALCLALPLAAQKAPGLKLATLLPKGGAQYQLLEEMKESFAKAAGGGAKLTILADYHEGESAMVDKMRLGGLQAGLISIVGLTQIEPKAAGLQYLPMMLRSLDELDQVKQKLATALERRLEAKGFVVLFWSDAGWLRFFSRKPIRTPADLKRQKLFNWAGDTAQYDLMKKHGYDPIPLEPADTKGALATGMLDAVAAVPFLALGHQYYAEAKYMLEIDWAPLVGAMVVTRQRWDSIPEATRSDLRRIATEYGSKITAKSRQENVDSVQAMVGKHGLVVTKPAAGELDEWTQMAAGLWPEIRGKIVPADVFDEVQQILAECRKQGSSGK